MEKAARQLFKKRKNSIKNKNKAPENVAYYVYGGVFMQKNEQATCEAAFLQRLSQLEDLAEKKLKIYSRLLTDTALAKDMETLSARHKKRKESLLTLACGKESKNNGEEGEE